MTITVSVDLNACQGYVCCVMEAPALFDLHEDEGKAVVLQPSPPPELVEQAKAAARVCPARAISVTDG